VAKWISRKKGFFNIAIGSSISSIMQQVRGAGRRGYGIDADSRIGGRQVDAMCGWSPGGPKLMPPWRFMMIAFAMGIIGTLAAVHDGRALATLAAVAMGSIGIIGTLATLERGRGASGDR
jgi:hypothetical protein